MPELLQDLLSSDGFMPHGHCYLWRPMLVRLHVIADALTALAYTSIPFTLIWAQGAQAKGVTFRFTLPAAPRPKTPSRAHPT